MYSLFWGWSNEGRGVFIWVSISNINSQKSLTAPLKSSLPYLILYYQEIVYKHHCMLYLLNLSSCHQWQLVKSLLTFWSSISCSFRRRSRSSISLCLKYLMKLREAWRPFWMEKHAASSLRKPETQTDQTALSSLKMFLFHSLLQMISCGCS